MIPIPGPGEARFGAARSVRRGRKSFRRALEIDPNYVEAIRGLSILCMQQGRTAEAIQFLERTVALRPNYTDAHFELGNL